MQALLDATDFALKRITEQRFFATERGYQGRFYCYLQSFLDSAGLLPEPWILEMEYQKSSRHGLSQRPDIILHIPAEISGHPVSENNIAVWALKRSATDDKAIEDFEKLDEMFDCLHYKFGFFINIDSNKNFAELYAGHHRDKLRFSSVLLRNGRPITNWA